MRNLICHSLTALFKREPFVFLTGDVGFKTLEPLREIMGNYFINAGVAEQNMISVAAGICRKGLSVWVYSIAPFCYARPFEQIRNDLALHKLPVKIIGNGGGYGYGVMGPTHHAIEDYGSLLTLQNFHAFIPAFADDIGSITEKSRTFPIPSYIRLGLCEEPKDFEIPPYVPWRKVLSGKKDTVLVIVGAIAGSYIHHMCAREKNLRPEIWVVTELPLETNPPPDEFLKRLKVVKKIGIIEEHVAQGGFGQMMALWLLKKGITIDRFDHFHAKGYPTHKYGSQHFHRKESGIDVENVLDYYRLLN